MHQIRFEFDYGYMSIHLFYSTYLYLGTYANILGMFIPIPTYNVRMAAQKNYTVKVIFTPVIPT